MESNFYTEQLVLQQEVHRISIILALLFLATAFILVMRNHRWRKRFRKKILAVSVGALLVWGGNIQTEASLPEDPVQTNVKNSAELQVIQGSRGSGDNNYNSQVCVAVHLKYSEITGIQDLLRIEYNTNSYAEALELDPGFGTSVSDQLQSLGIAWITLVAESGMAETGEGKSLQFMVKTNGNYCFQVSGKTLSFSIGEQFIGETAVTESKENGVVFPSGNEDEKEEEHKDERAPEINMDLSLFRAANNQLFLKSSSVTIQVKEEHFDPSWKPEVQTRVKDGYSFSDWKVTEKGATGTLDFFGDGEYNIVFQCKDQAGNTSERIESGFFTVDKTNPQITIKGVENKLVYGSSVTPVIQVEDASFNIAELTCSLRGAKSGEVDVEAVSDLIRTGNGISIAMNRFPEEQDDVYTLSIQAGDQAGNEAQEEIIFATDQYGSSYIFSDATRKLVEDYYISEPMELVLSELNTSEIVYRLTLSKDGVPQKLEEGKDFSVEVRGGDGDWLIYTYHIFAGNFQEEGVYHVDITSRDKGENVNNNQVRGARIDFALDKTPPVLVISNLENGASYQEKEHPFLVQVSDKTRLASLQILINGEIVYDESNPENQLTFILEEAEEEQLIQIHAEDKAGNRILSEEYKVIVQSNQEILSNITIDKDKTGDTEAGEIEETGGMETEGRIDTGEETHKKIMVLSLLLILPVSLFFFMIIKRKRKALKKTAKK